MFVFLRQELEQLKARIQTLQDSGKPAQAELSSPSATSPGDHEDTQPVAGLEDGVERVTGGKEEKEGEGDEELSTDAELKDREKAALTIQASWRKHRNRVCNTPQLCKRSYLCVREILCKKKKSPDTRFLLSPPLCILS